jgi:hypothetical protein
VLQKLVYNYSYRKLRQRFLKRAKILDQYHTFIGSFRDNITSEDAERLNATYELLLTIQELLQNETPPHGQALTKLVQKIDLLSEGWHEDLKDAKGKGVLLQWDNLPCKSRLAFHIYDHIVISHF